MVVGLDVLGATASALQIVGMICSLGNRILDKPKDTKSVRSIAFDAKSYIRHLEHWSLTITGDAKEACEELHEQLQSLVDEIDGHKGKKALEKAKTCLKLYRPEFRDKFADALDKFKFRMCVESRRSVADMDDKLMGMTKSMDELRITSKTLETLPGMEQGVAKVEEKMEEVSRDISALTRAVENVQLALHRLDATSIGKAQIDELIRSDGDVTRERIRRFAGSVSEVVEKVHERQMLNESIIKITTEILPRSSNLVWYDGSTTNPTFKIWSLDEPPDESKRSAPQANFAGLELSSISLETTYDELHEKRYIADDLEEDVREKKQRRVSDLSPYVNLVRRRDSLEELREFVPPRFEQRFKNELPRETQLEALRVARSLSQEYRYVVLDQILQQKAHTLPKLHLLEDMERAMLAVHSNKLEARLEFVIRNVVNDVDFPYRLLVAVEENGIRTSVLPYFHLLSGDHVRFPCNARPLKDDKLSKYRTGFRLASEMAAEHFGPRGRHRSSDLVRILLRYLNRWLRGKRRDATPTILDIWNVVESAFPASPKDEVLQRTFQISALHEDDGISIVAKGPHRSMFDLRAYYLVVTLFRPYTEEIQRF